MSEAGAPTNPDEFAIELANVTVQYRTQRSPSLHDVSLRIGWGEKVAIIGPSGSGKSTLAHLLNGLIPHRFQADVTGDIRVGGVDPATARLTDTSSRIGTVLQDSDAQFVALTVAEDIAFSLENQETQPQAMPAIVAGVAERVAVAPLLEQSPHDLSGGQKQRVSVGGVLVDDVPILLFDEPLANLDPATGLATIELIDELHRDHDKTVVIVEHRLEEVLHRRIDRIIAIEGGRIVASGTPDEIVSGSLLEELGIRPPLHLKALRYAGVDPSPQNRPSRMETLTMTEEDLARVQRWGIAVREAPVGETVERNAGTPAVELRDVVCRLGQTRDDAGVAALDGVDLTIQQGELLTVLGTNGAGKSTLARAIAGFVRPQRGTVLIAGKDTEAASISEIGEDVAFVLQDPGQMISKSMIADEVALGPRARGLPESEVQQLLENALRVCGLWPYRSWPISALSHGQRKRVTIAAGLVVRPEILILDEPTAGQDFRHFTEFMEFVKTIHQRGTTVVVVTHDMHLALEYSRRAVVMHAGSIIADDTPEAVLTNETVIERANLVRTSLYDLAARVGLDDDRKDGFGRSEFVAGFVAEDRRRRAHG